VTSIGFRKGTYLRGYMVDFINAFAPHLTRDVIEKVTAISDRQARVNFFDSIELPTY
jgi:LysR family cys regulon transcriptional activator